MILVLYDRVQAIEATSVSEVQSHLGSILTEHKYVGDIKALAEKYGLHYLRSKKMRRRELEAWIMDNHPAVLEVRRKMSERKDGV